MEKFLHRPYVEVPLIGNFYMEGPQSNHFVEKETETQGLLIGSKSG